MLRGAQSIFHIIHSSHLSKFKHIAAGFFAILWPARKIHLRGDMPTHPRKHSDATQVTAEILKEAARFACKWKKKTASHQDRKDMCEIGFREVYKK